MEKPAGVNDADTDFLTNLLSVAPERGEKATPEMNQYGSRLGDPLLGRASNRHLARTGECDEICLLLCSSVSSS
jgi:hypothetical protein